MNSILQTRRSFVLAALAGGVVPARAQSGKGIKIVVPFAPGGGNDVFARQLAKGLGELRGQSVVVENKAGGGGMVGTEQVIHSPPDAATLLLGHTGTVSINPALSKQSKVDPRVDLVPVAMFASAPLVLVVPATSALKTVADLLAAARAAPGMLSYASSGNGTGGHLTGALFEQLGGLKISHVPYKGTSPALTDLVGGQVQMMFSVIPPALALVRGGRLRAIAVTSAGRLPSLPDVPTIAESGVAALAKFESSLTYGILAPRGTPDAAVKELSAQILKVAATPEFQSRLEADGAEPLLGGAVPYAALIKRESAKWAEIVKVSGATSD